MYNILVCDDEKDIVSALKIYLTSDGYRVYEAYDGQEAVDIIRNEDIFRESGWISGALGNWILRSLIWIHFMD